MPAFEINNSNNVVVRFSSHNEKAAKKSENLIKLIQSGKKLKSWYLAKFDVKKAASNYLIPNTRTTLNSL